MRKLQKHLRRGLFCESCGITDHSLLIVKLNTYALLAKALIAALKDRKSSQTRYEGKSAFQTFAFELYKQIKTKTKKEHTRLVIVSVGVNVVAKNR